MVDEINETPVFNENVHKFTTEDPVHADLFNEVIEKLLSNDLFLKNFIKNLSEKIPTLTNSLLATEAGKSALDAALGPVIKKELNAKASKELEELYPDVGIKTVKSGNGVGIGCKLSSGAFTNISLGNRKGVIGYVWIDYMEEGETYTHSVRILTANDFAWKLLGIATNDNPLAFPKSWREMLVFGTNGYYIGTVTLVPNSPELHYMIGIDSNHVRFTISEDVITLQSSKLDGKENNTATTGFTPSLTVYYR